MKKLNTDLSKLSNIPEEYLDKLSNVSSGLIGNAFYESILASKNIVEIDLGYGKLVIKSDLDEVKVKFIPSDELQADLKNINQGGEPTLKRKLERSISSKLMDMYKEIV